jgi:hypothetical protein
MPKRRQRRPKNGKRPIDLPCGWRITSLRLEQGVISRIAKWSWCTAAVIVVLALGMLAFVPRGDARHWQFEFQPTQWQVWRESLQLPATRQFAKIYAVGPIRITMTRHPRFAPLGTNELRVGNVLYNGLTEFEIGRVVGPRSVA